MDEETRRQKWKNETDEIYRAIGEFVVKFEHVCLGMNVAIAAMLERAGLRDQRIGSVLIANLTADPLRVLFESLVAQTGWLKGKQHEELRQLLIRVQKLTAERNDIVHGAWLIDWYNYSSLQNDFSSASGFKLHKNKKGVATKSFEKTVSDFRKLTAEAESLRDALHKILGHFIFDENGNQVALKYSESV